MASLLTIPLEILVSISSELSTSDLGALRRTCKHVETSLYEWFSSEFFTKKQFMLTKPSLQALIDISKHASFSKKLKHVIIALNLYDAKPRQFRHEDAALFYLKGLQSQRRLLGSGLGSKMLIEAFENLPNLDTVGIRDFNAGNRLRDNGSWSSWGATTVLQDTGVALQIADHAHYRTHAEADKMDFEDRVFSMVLYALGRANCTPSQLEVLLRHRALPDQALDVDDLRPSVDNVLQNLTALLLNVELIPELFLVYGRGSNIPQIPAGLPLRQFLSYTPNLTHLRLNLSASAYPSNLVFLEWLGQQPPSLAQSPANIFHVPPINLPCLKQLEFGQVSVDNYQKLLEIIVKFAPTLVELSLWKMSIISLQRQGDPKPNLWRGFLAGLAKIPQLQLTHLKVGMLKQDNLYVQFKEGDDEKAPKLKQKEYTGQQMGKFINELKEQVIVLWPEPIVAPEDEDEEMEDDEEDYEDEDDEDDEDDDDDDDDEEEEEEEDDDDEE